MNSCPAAPPEPAVQAPAPPRGSGNSRLVLLATNYQSGAVEGRNLGTSGYSYDFVFRQFAPLLNRVADLELVRDTEAMQRRFTELTRAGRPVVHVGFRALHELEEVPGIPRIVVPAWEFPDLPAHCRGSDARQNWVAVANSCDLIIQLCDFTRQTFQRSGVTTPMAVVPVPVAAEYFDVDCWKPGQKVVLETDVTVLSGPSERDEALRNGRAPGGAVGGERRSLASALRNLARKSFTRFVRPRLPWWLDRGIAAGVRESLARWSAPGSERVRESSRVELSGIVYTSVFNPYDNRKNWEDLLSGFLLALGDRADVTLVLKLVRNDRFGAQEVIARYQALGIPHQCRVVLLTGFLSETQMCDLARATTFYLTTTRAEGACLPLMQWLAAGRPAVSPRHTAISDYFSDAVGFVVESHPEPCAWPHGSDRRLRTSWHRLVWSSLVEQLRGSYEVARADRQRYAALSAAAREMSLGRHHPESVRVNLEEALAPFTGAL